MEWLNKTINHPRRWRTPKLIRIPINSIYYNWKKCKDIRIYNTLFLDILTPKIVLKKYLKVHIVCREHSSWCAVLNIYGLWISLPWRICWYIMKVKLLKLSICYIKSQSKLYIRHGYLCGFIGRDWAGRSSAGFKSTKQMVQWYQINKCKCTHLQGISAATDLPVLVHFGRGHKCTCCIQVACLSPPCWFLSILHSTALLLCLSLVFHWEESKDIRNPRDIRMLHKHN